MYHDNDCVATARAEGTDNKGRKEKATWKFLAAFNILREDVSESVYAFEWMNMAVIMEENINSMRAKSLLWEIPFYF